MLLQALLVKLHSEESLLELDFHIAKTLIIYCDNVDVTYFYENPVFHSQMKHIAVDFHHVHRQVQHKVVQVLHIHATNQLSNILNKALAKLTFQMLSFQVRLRSTLPHLRGMY